MPSRWAKRQPRQSRARFTFEVILEAAQQLLAQGRDLNTQTIAERAGVGVGSVYDYFSDKIAVLGELGERVLQSNADQSADHFEWLLRRDDLPIRMIRQFILGAARRRKAPVVRRLLRMATDLGHREFINAYLDRVDEVLQAAVARHPTLDAPPVGVSLVTRAVSAALEHAAERTDWLDDPERMAQVVDELTLMVHAYATVDRAAWLARMRGEAEDPDP